MWSVSSIRYMGCLILFAILYAFTYSYYSTYISYILLLIVHIIFLGVVALDSESEFLIRVIPWDMDGNNELNVKHIVLLCSVLTITTTAIIVSMYRMLNQMYANTGISTPYFVQHGNIRNVMIMETIFMMGLVYLTQQKQVDMDKIFRRIPLGATYIVLILGVAMACFNVWSSTELSYRMGVMHKVQTSMNQPRISGAVF